jgi:formylglycine-generating enzyme required for sulfatase activity
MKCATLFVMILTGLLAAGTMTWARPSERVSPTPLCNKKAVVWRVLEMPKDAHNGDLWINPVDGMEMVYIGAGSFRMGGNEIADERPYRRAHHGGYWISRYEVTVTQYKKFGEIAKRYLPDPPQTGWLSNAPIVNVDWNDAAAYAKWANGRLATEPEWEKAARGYKGRIYPWGNAWDAARCNHGLDGKNAPTRVGSFPGGASYYGLMDMAGNASEWCAAAFTKPGDIAEYRIIRGGSCHDVSAEAFRCSRRDYLAPSTRASVIGFRYVMDAR